MATLIKLRQKPQKYLLKKSLMNTKVNFVLTSAARVERALRIRELESECERARAMIKDFCRKRKTIENQSLARGEERAKQHMVTEMFLTCAEFFKGLHTEALAMEKLARKIAVNITNLPDSSPLDPSVAIAESLSTSLRMVIKAPQETLGNFTQEVKKLSHKIGAPIEMQTSLDDSVELGIIVAGHETFFTLEENSLLAGLQRCSI